MARPRVFVSSTFYDLKHIRASLENFIESFGFDAILFERGDIPFHPDRALDQSCYQEAEGADIFVLIIGGRYGSRVSNQSQDTSGNPETYQSITRKEFETAQNKNIPTFILVENAVMTEYDTFIRNRDNKNIKYAHVDNVNVFHFIDVILKKQRNNPTFKFEKSTQIESWLREQWSGLFRDLLRSRSQQQQLATLSSQVAELKSINDTLKRYMETIMKETNPKESENFIKIENEKIDKLKEMYLLKNNILFQYLMKIYEEEYDEDNILSLIKNPKTAKEVLKQWRQLDIHEYEKNLFKNTITQREYNKARITLKLPPIKFNDDI